MDDIITGIGTEISMEIRPYKIEFNKMNHLFLIKMDNLSQKIKSQVTSLVISSVPCPLLG